MSGNVVFTEKDDFSNIQVTVDNYGLDFTWSNQLSTVKGVTFGVSLDFALAKKIVYAIKQILDFNSDFPTSHALTLATNGPKPLRMNLIKSLGRTSKFTLSIDEEGTEVNARSMHLVVSRKKLEELAAVIIAHWHRDFRTTSIHQPKIKSLN